MKNSPRNGRGIANKRTHCKTSTPIRLTSGCPTYFSFVKWDMVSLVEPCIGVLFDVEEFHLEDQVGVTRDQGADSAGAVAQLGGDHEGAFSADFHARDALLPSGNDLAQAQIE